MIKPAWLNKLLVIAGTSNGTEVFAIEVL